MRAVERWFKHLFLEHEVEPPREVPQDAVRTKKRLEAERETLQSMRRLALNESDPQFLSYVIKREGELDRLIDAQLEGEFDVITEKGQREGPGGRDECGADDR